jgi:hypothetical protein
MTRASVTPGGSRIAFLSRSCMRGPIPGRLVAEANNGTSRGGRMGHNARMANGEWRMGFVHSRSALRHSPILVASLRRRFSVGAGRTI